MPDASTPHDVLATTLAAAFPTWEARSALAREAGLGDVQLTGDATAVWRDLVDEGAQRGRLDALLRAADARRPGWRRARWLRYAPLAAVLAVLAVAPLAYRLVVTPAAVDGGDAAVEVAPAAVDGGDAPVGAVVAPDAGVPVGGAPDQATPAAPATVAAPAVPAPAAAPPDRAPAPAAAPPDRAPAPAAAPASAAAATPSAVTPGSCAGKTGWAYLGTTTDVVASDAWTLTRSYNVRTDYPRRDNHYAMAPTICVLHPGDIVAVPDGPQPVDGGAFWIRIQGR